MTSRNDIRVYETGLRSLCLLTRYAESGLTLDEMVGIDFYITRSNALDLPNDDLNGCAKLRNSEIAARRQRMKAALAIFASRGFIECISTSRGIAFSPTPLGKEVANGLHGDYADRIKKNIDCYLEQLEANNSENRQDTDK